MKKIADYLSKEDILIQLAEKAGELATAAAKTAQKLRNKSPTPKKINECWDNLWEEYADVQNCIHALQPSMLTCSIVEEIEEEKYMRWLNRLRGRDGIDEQVY